MAAVMIAASRRAPAAQARSRAGLGRESERQYFGVSTLKRDSRDTISSCVLSSGSNLASPFSLNACASLTNLLSRYAPGFMILSGEKYFDAGVSLRC